MKYKKNDKFDFGLYKDYEVGIIFIFDFKYIEWCIENIEEFCIEDLDELLHYRNFGKCALEGKRDIRIPEAVAGIDLFETFEDFVREIGDEMRIVSGKKYYPIFKPETLILNQKRILENDV